MADCGGFGKLLLMWLSLSWPHQRLTTPSDSRLISNRAEEPTKRKSFRMMKYPVVQINSSTMNVVTLETQRPNGSSESKSVQRTKSCKSRELSRIPTLLERKLENL